MEAKFQELKNRLAEVHDLETAAAVLIWDQRTYMPPGGAEARGRQLARLERLAHEKFIEPSIARLLEELRPYEESLPYESDEASLIRVARRDYEKAVRVPPEFTQELASHTAVSYAAWEKARPADDFGAVQPYLERTLGLSRRLADFFPGYEHIADPLIDYRDQGMTAASLQSLFGELRERLVPLARAIAAQPAADDSCLHRTYPEEQQLAFGLEVIRRFGYDFERGRQDKTAHPFMITFSLGDIRITTRVKENDLGDALFSTMHEAGHALYEQGIPMALEGTPLADGTSSGVHESQSRTWENQVGRSRGFWTFFYPRLQAVFPDQLGSVPLDTFYRAVNKVQPSLIRTDADEVTYNLHVMLRFDLELAMLEGSLAVKDLPEVWNERMKADLGVTPSDDRDGVLQDVHWFGHHVGGVFQGYTLGNIMAAQFCARAAEERPSIPNEIESGEFGGLLAWLRQNLYRHGRKFTAAELVERVTGGPLSIEPYMRYLETKYGELYEL